MEKQTAVNWLEERLKLTPKPILNSDIDKFFERAKSLEKQQIVEFGKVCADKWGMTTVPESTIETLFESTFKKTNL